MDQKISAGHTIYASTLDPMMQVYIQDMLCKISGWEKATKKPSKFCMVKILNRKLIWERKRDQFLKILIFVEIHGMQFYFAGSYNFQSSKIGSFNNHGTNSDDGVIESCRTVNGNYMLFITFLQFCANQTFRCEKPVTWVRLPCLEYIRWVS